MRTLKKCITGLLVLSLIGLYLPKNSYCAGSGLFAKTDEKTITRHKPRIKSAPEKDIPIEKTEAGKKKGKNWLLIGAGAALVVGLVAGGGGGGGGGNNPPSSTGSITVGW